MGLFENLGRKVGKITHEAKQAAAEEARYSCEDCDNRFYAERETCSECGSENIVEREPTESTDDRDEADSTAQSESADDEPNANDEAESDVNSDEPTDDETEPSE
ncbi:zinc ribbon domain-containing protein [Natrialbaceae archaeon A-arb3/5]